MKKNQRCLHIVVKSISKKYLAIARKSTMSTFACLKCMSKYILVVQEINYVYKEMIEVYE